MNITLLLPTRGRVDSLKRLIKSVDDTAHKPEEIEFSFYVDGDDKETVAFLDTILGGRFKVTVGKRILLSKMWNEALKLATSDIFMHCGDDIVFGSSNWDRYVLREFNKYPDKIVFVHGNDLSPSGDSFGTHGFLHRRWVESTGYFCPPYFSCDYNDTWLNDVANMLHRRAYIPIVTEHMHFTFGKGPKDQTHIDRIERGRKDNVPSLYAKLVDKRIEDVKKLSEVIRNYEKAR